MVILLKSLKRLETFWLEWRNKLWLEESSIILELPV